MGTVGSLFHDQPDPLPVPAYRPREQGTDVVPTSSWAGSTAATAPPPPIEKPVTNLQLLIESFTHSNAIVLDPFAGSGSNCVTAVRAGRSYIGIELHKAGITRLSAVQHAM